MIVDRRATLAGLMGGAVLGAVPARTAFEGDAGVLFIDSRRSASTALVSASPAARVIDIARAHDTFWAEVRGFAPGAGRVRGLTGWSDWVLLRGALQDKGLRVRMERPLDPARTGDGALFLWEMA